jgi:drug/metabolite transporter (DMT)-like permease
MIKGILLKLLSTLAFTFMSAAVKQIALAHPGQPLYYPVGQTVFFRSFFALIPVFIWLAWRGELIKSFQNSPIRLHARRGLFGSIGMFSGFTGLMLLPLADATAISYAAPLFTVVLAALILKEEVRGYRWAAVLVGFAGVVVMLLPQLEAGPGFDPMRRIGTAFALLGALCAGFATIETRKLTESQTTGAIVSYFMVLTSLIGLASYFVGFAYPEFSWRLPTFPDGLLLILMGVMGGIGQIALTQSFRYAEASMVAPFDYVSMVWAILVGWFFFGELPKLVVVLGSIMVVLAGIFVILRERQLGLDRSQSKKAGPSRSI